MANKAIAVSKQHSKQHILSIDMVFQKTKEKNSIL